MEENIEKLTTGNDLVEQFGFYDPELDLSNYLYPDLGLLSDSFSSVITALKKERVTNELPILLDSSEVIVCKDLYQYPNVLLAGTIASGKTQFIYNQLVAWFYIFHPAELKLVICRTKPVDYNSIAKVEKHFLAKSSRHAAITEEGEVLGTIKSLNIECDQRLALFHSAGVKNLKDYNQLFISRRLNPEEGHRFLPYVVLIMDDFQNFLQGSVTEALIELTQKNMYTGIFLLAVTSQIMARNITPQLRANFSVRLAMHLMSQNESRKILDRAGAEKLHQPGLMLYEQGDKLVVGKQPFIPYNQINAICAYIQAQRGYPSAYLLPTTNFQFTDEIDFDLSKRDAMFEEAARIIVQHQQGSTSLIQRKLKLGYHRAGRIIDQLESAGIVGPFEGTAAREVLYPDEYSLEQFLETLFGNGKSVAERDSIDSLGLYNSGKTKSAFSGNSKKSRTKTQKKAVKKGIIAKNVQVSTNKSDRQSIFIICLILLVVVASITYFFGGL